MTTYFIIYFTFAFITFLWTTSLHPILPLFVHINLLASTNSPVKQYTHVMTNIYYALSWQNAILLAIPEYLDSPPMFDGVCVTRSLVLCVILCRSVLPCFFWGEAFRCKTEVGPNSPQSFVRYSLS
jgi:hypothetical protein